MFTTVNIWWIFTLSLFFNYKDLLLSFILYNLDSSPDMNGFLDSFLNGLSTIAILSSICVITSINTVISLLFLIFLFATVALYLIMIDVVFIGISYLLVYIGAVTILFIFVLMLIDIKSTEITSYTKNSAPLGVLIAILFFIPINKVISYNIVGDNVFKEEIMYVISYIWDGNITFTSDIASLGNVMYSSNPIWLIITSLVLLLSMVGAIVITIH